MKRILPFFLLAVLLLSCCSGALAAVEKSPFLDAAFQMIEKDNIFLRRYNELTGSNVEALFELGVPYYFGGQDIDKTLKNYPDYYVYHPFENTKYYKKTNLYVYGFDCSGYTNWIRETCGLPKHDSLSNMILKYEYKRANVEAGEAGHLYNYKNDTNYKPMPPYDELHETLRVGDLLVGKHDGARHVMMYIGTLEDFGFTAEEVPDLADYLDYPLVIHCGPSPFYGERFQALIDQKKSEGVKSFQNCVTTNGGVEVSIIGVPLEAAPYHAHVQINDFDYFLIDQGNYMLTIWDLPNCTSFCWFRMP